MAEDAVVTQCMEQAAEALDRHKRRIRLPNMFERVPEGTNSLMHQEPTKEEQEAFDQWLCDQETERILEDLEAIANSGKAGK
jgi:hypothetical protein